MHHIRPLARCLLLVGLTCLAVAWVAAWYPVDRSYGDVTGSCGSVDTPRPEVARDTYCQIRIDARRHTAHTALALGLVSAGLGLIGLIALPRGKRDSPRREEGLDAARPVPPET
jgi:hypothetical protein